MTRQLEEDLEQQEKILARRLDLETWPTLRLVLGLAFALWLVTLVLPFTTAGVRTYEVLFVSSSARGMGITLTEFVFVVLTAIGPGILNLVFILTRSTMVSWVLWMFSCVSAFFIVLALWLRQTAVENAAGDASFGMYLSILPVLVCVGVSSSIILRRTPEQLSMAERRRAEDHLDSVGVAQAEEFKSQNQRRWETNPLLIDDRRAQAHARTARSGRKTAGHRHPESEDSTPA